MKNHLSSLIVLMPVLFWTGCRTYGAQDASNQQSRISILANDGSRVFGILDAESFMLKTDLGELKVPVLKVKKIDWPKPGGINVQAWMRNGDKLTGQIEQTEWNIKSLFGVIAVPAESLQELVVLGPSGHPEGLLFWNQLGSDMEIQSSAVGPGGMRKGGQFAPGVEGGAFEAQWNEADSVVFEDVPLNGEEGCIEIWAKFKTPPFRLANGANPFLFRLSTGDFNFDIAFTGNNGNGFAGLSGVANWLGVAGTDTIRDMSYNDAIGGMDVREWHHYALVWKKAGLRDILDVDKRVAVLVDGKVNSTKWLSHDFVKVAENNRGKLVLLLNHHMNSGSVSVDEIKIWDSAKTTFPEIEETRKGQ